jgi:hypothetical protein
MNKKAYFAMVLSTACLLISLVSAYLYRTVPGYKDLFIEIAIVAGVISFVSYTRYKKNKVSTPRYRAVKFERAGSDVEMWVVQEYGVHLEHDGTTTLGYEQIGSTFNTAEQAQAYLNSLLVMGGQCKYTYYTPDELRAELETKHLGL